MPASCQIFRRADGRVMPWKNGGGSTLELLREPGDTPDDPPTLRVSIADLVAEGPFSPFPNVDRIILLLEGAGIRLVFPDCAVTLDVQGAPFAFAGETPCHCTLLPPSDAPPALVRDLNLMVDRRRLRLSAHALADSSFEPPQPGVRHLVVALESKVVLRCANLETVTLELGDLALPSRGGSVSGRYLFAEVAPA